IQDDKEDEEAEDEDVEDEDMEDEDVEDGDVEDEEVEDEDVEDEDVEDGDVEDEEVEDEDVEDEEVEDEDVEDEEAEIEVLKEAAFISRHNRNVDFVHRTAVEYIREKYDITGPDSSSLVEAKAQIARAHIGSLALFRLFPFRYSQGARHGNNRLFWLLKDTMTAILALGSHAIMTGVDVSIQSVQVDLTDQAIQTFRNPVLFDCFAEQNFINEVSLLRLQCIYECGLIQDDLADLVSWCLKSDRLLVAAFFGCNHYVQRRMSTDNVSRERNIILLEVALAGFNYSVNNRDSVSRRGFHHSFLRFLIIQALLKHDLDPNKPCPLARPQWWCEQYGTLWGMFFVLLIDATQISLLYGIPATDRLPWATLCTDLITKFLSLGANPNARVGLNHGFISRNDKSYHFYSEQSLLALWECVRPETAQILPTIGARLQSAGGFHDREFRIMEHEDSFYPVSHFQSQRLNEAVRSGLTEEASSHYLRVAYRMRYLTEFSGEVFTEIVTSIMAEAPIDEEEAISMMPLKLPEESF
ncbi:MAG: hypothetical protein LQ338_008288, partial [Usnochroma carphineum]